MTAPITGITLEGYQVFENSTFIPLDRLNLLFGPNSAGKSAIHDAIKLGQLLLLSRAKKFDTTKFFGTSFDDSEVLELLKRHWRRQPGGGKVFAPSLKIEIHHTTSCAADQVIADKLNQEIPEHLQYNQSDDLKLQSRWHFYDLDAEDDDFTFKWNYELYIESNFILGYIGECFTINLNHPLIKHLQKISYKNALSQHPEFLEYKTGSLTFKLCILGFQPSAIDFSEKGKNWLHYNAPSFYQIAGSDSSDLPLLKQVISEVSLLTGSIITATQGNTNINARFVDASRRTPSPEHLTFELGYCYDQLIESPATGDQAYKSLATSLASSLGNSQTLSPSTSPTQLAENVNRALAHHLFLDQGYQLDFDYRIILSKKNSKSALQGYELDAEEFGYVVQLFVRDNHGRKHRIDDVGSGIGYLIPVLSATYEGSWNSSPCFVQQPELHIHPALQAALGDVFVDASTKKQLIVETHSEHLLLRILKRIRQTHSNNNIADELKIQAQDVCILYFDPSPRGHTVVKRLRISHDGEFMDRWPHGFFVERDRELLDE